MMGLGLIFFLIILVVLALFFLRKNNIKSVEETRALCATKNSAYFQYRDVNCHYTDKGTGDAVVLIHGLGDSFRIFDQFAKDLSKNYRVIRVDLPGFGLSEVPSKDLEIDDLIEYYRGFLTAFVEELELQKFHLFGNSLGGWVAWDWTTYHNDKVNTLCLLASAGFEMAKVKKNITKGVLELIPESLLQRGMPLSVARLNAKETIYQREHRTAEHIRANYQMINKKGTLNFMFRMLMSSFAPDTERIKEVKVPTLIVWGTKDRIIPVKHADLFEKSIANSTKVIYPRCGHYPQIEFSENLMTDWTAFLK